jgi:hypothetical protein
MAKVQMESTTFKVFDYVFPVISVNVSANGERKVRDVLGTAFSIGGDVFLTAGHVVRNAQESQTWDVSALVDDKWLAHDIPETELLDDHDLALIRVSIEHARAFQLGN